MFFIYSYFLLIDCSQIYLFIDSFKLISQCLILIQHRPYIFIVAHFVRKCLNIQTKLVLFIILFRVVLIILKLINPWLWFTVLTPLLNQPVSALFELGHTGPEHNVELVVQVLVPARPALVGVCRPWPLPH